MILMQNYYFCPIQQSQPEKKSKKISIYLEVSPNMPNFASLLGKGSPTAAHSKHKAGPIAQLVRAPDS